MKICYPFCGNVIGGGEKYAIYLAKEARKSGNDVRFLLSEDGDFSKRLEDLGFVCDVIPMKSSFNPFMMLNSVFLLRKYYRENKIDVVHSNFLREHSLSIGAKFLGSGAKVIRTVHRLDQFDWKMKPLLWFYNWQTDVFIAVSEYLKSNLIEGGFNRKIKVIYNGAPEIMAAKHEKAIGFLGRVVPEKGILKFIEENKEILKKDQLIIAGSGGDLKEIKKIKEKNQLNIKILGEITKLEEFFSKISVLVLPSKEESTLPLSVIEAFSCGVPVVSFLIPPIQDTTLDSGASILVKKGDYKKLGKEVKKLLYEDNILSKMIDSARKLYREKYTIEKMWQKTGSLYELVTRDKEQVTRT